MPFKMTRNIAAISFAGLAALGGAFASAAGLGTITEGTLGAGTVVIASCETTAPAPALTYTTSYNATSGKYQVSGINVANLDTACNGKTGKVTLKDSTGAVLGVTPNGTVASGALALTLTTAADAETAVGAALVIHG
jgi:hypothetical protein